MKHGIEDRTINVAAYIINTKCTVREAASYFGLSKSIIHKDMVYRLPMISANLTAEVRKILDEHLNVRHIRGGQATKEKYATNH